MPAPPIVSVAIPVHHRRHFIAEAIASALGQSLREFELAVVDDGSTDGTAEDARRLFEG